MDVICFHPGGGSILRQMLRYLYIIIWITLTATAVCVAQEAEIQQSSAWPALMTSIKIEQPIAFCGEAVDVDNQEVRERLEKELLIALWDRPQVILWIKRSPRYLPIIEKMLHENGMPDDLKYVAIVESALRPHAGSHKGATVTEPVA